MYTVAYLFKITYYAENFLWNVRNAWSAIKMWCIWLAIVNHRFCKPIIDINISNEIRDLVPNLTFWMEIYWLIYDGLCNICLLSLVLINQILSLCSYTIIAHEHLEIVCPGQYS